MKSDDLQSRTRHHYDDRPLDFLSAEDEGDIANQQPSAFKRFVETYVKAGLRIADIGCGPGRATLYLTRLGVSVTALDLSMTSLKLARARAPEASFVCASNLALPLADASFDVVVSDGVIHHTPDARASFRENARLVNAGGWLYLGVYRRYRYYYYLYRYVGAPLRFLAQWRWGLALIHATLLPLYYLAHQIKTGGKRSWRGATNFFHDYFLTPQATFHTKEEVVGWARDAGLTLLDYDEHVGNVHAFVFRREK